jgi:hypothetical protein
MAGKAQTADQQKREGRGCHELLIKYLWIVKSQEIIHSILVNAKYHL